MRPSYTRLSGRLPQGAGSNPAGTTSLGGNMKIVIEGSFPLRGQRIGSYYSFPVYSDRIEETLIRELEFLNQYDEFSLEMKITKGPKNSS